MEINQPSHTSAQSFEGERFSMSSKSLYTLPCIPGISWLRASLSVAVVAWHMNSFGKSLIFDNKEYLRHVFALSDLINFQVLLLAVPTFFLISCYLYARKNPSLHYYTKRISRLAILAVFWTLAAWIWVVLVIGYHRLPSLPPPSLQSFTIIVLSAGYTPYYFFVSLIILTTITHIFSKLSTILNIIMFISTCLLIFILPKITMNYTLYTLSVFWNPLNFIPYPFAAILLAREDLLSVKQNPNLWIITVLLVISILLSFYEWRFYIHEIFFRGGQSAAIPAYTRLSVVCSSIMLFFIALTSRIKTNRIIDFMSRQSLSLYCLHVFIFFIVFPNFFSTLAVLSLPAFLIEIFKIVIILFVCYITSYLLKMVLNKFSRVTG